MKTTPARRKPATIDEYLASLAPRPRATLEKLRKAIKAAAPGAEECISYGLAAFRLDGVLIAGLGAGADHCAYYPMSGKTVETVKDELAGYETSKGTIRFPPEKPLPGALVKKLIKARLAEGATRRT